MADNQDAPRVLIPLEEALQREANASYAEIVTGYSSRAIDPADLVLRYDPPPHRPRHTPNPRFFYSGEGRGGSRVRYTGGRHRPWSRY